MRGEMHSAVPPRDIDRYPRNVIVDFRRCQASTLKKYCQKYDLQPHSSVPEAELPSLVARHFHSEMQVKEDSVLRKFAEYTLSYSGGNTLDEVKSKNTKRMRKQTRRTKVSTNSDNSEMDMSDDVELALYCVCQQPSFGEMVACDGPDCQSGEWFHVSCVGLREGEARTGQWFCPDCLAKGSNGDGRRRRNAAKKRFGTDAS